MRVLTNGSLIVEAFDMYCYMQERLVLACRANDAQSQWQQIEIQLSRSGSILATYNVTSSKRCYIDVTDYIRLDYEQGEGEGTFVVEAVSSGGIGSVSVPWEVYGSISPVRLHAPVTPEAELAADETQAADGVSWCMPRKIIQPISTGRIICYNLRGCQFGIVADTTTSKYIGSAGYCYVDYGEAVKALTLSYMHATPAIPVQNVQIVERMCGVQYVDVKWQNGLARNTKRATWELCEHKVSTANELSLLTPTGDYNEPKGRKDSFVLRLDDLTAYDMWYYGDIVSSNKVQISFDGTNWHTVRVDTNEVQIPDTDVGKLYELKINITFAEYDAIIV